MTRPPMQGGRGRGSSRGGRGGRRGGHGWHSGRGEQGGPWQGPGGPDMEGGPDYYGMEGEGMPPGMNPMMMPNMDMPPIMGMGPPGVPPPPNQGGSPYGPGPGLHGPPGPHGLHGPHGGPPHGPYDHGPPGPLPGPPGPPPMMGGSGRGPPGPPMGEMGPDMMGGMGGYGPNRPMGQGGPGGPRMGYDPSLAPLGQSQMGPMGSMGRGGPRGPPPPRFGGSMPGAGPGSSTKVLSNDYCQHFVDTGQRPANFLRDSNLSDRYEEYPKLKELISLKAELTLKDPETWSWQEIMALEIEKIADTPSFVFLWCGNAEGLDAGRHCLKKWGFRRSEDICWIKTNKEGKDRKYLSHVHQDQEHCILGIRGSVRRANDGHLLHTNVDTDVLVAEEPAPLGSTEKPEEMYQIIERFCQGRRRLELFGEDRNIRPGWVTVGRSIASSNFNPSTYSSNFKNPDGTPYVENRGGKLSPNAPNLMPRNDEIEALRPRSPPPR
eukprot:gene14419-20424_t